MLHMYSLRTQNFLAIAISRSYIWTSAELRKDAPAPLFRHSTHFLANIELKEFLPLINLENVRSIITSSQYSNIYYL